MSNLVPIWYLLPPKIFFSTPYKFPLLADTYIKYQISKT